MSRRRSVFACLEITSGLLALLAVCSGCLDRPVAPQQPSTVRLTTQLYRATSIDKIDILFMIDNSASMADKQDILADAVPDLVKRLTQPRCMNPEGVVAAAQDAESCPPGFKREFAPVKDIHVGVITSSLGGMACSESSEPQRNDRAHLIDRTRSGGLVSTFEQKGFLFWDPEQKGSPPGESDSARLIASFTDIVRGTGQVGCGFEASLEAWYRFLIDPKPYQELVAVPCDPSRPQELNCRAPSGVDELVLRNRADFLRPDSLLALVMLTDENDCSLMDSGQAYVTQAAGFRMPKGTTACQTDPLSPDCVPCLARPDDPACATPYTAEEDDFNLRCFRQKQRFGLDFLWPVKRYVNGLTRKTFTADDIARGLNPGFRPDTDINPLFCSVYEQVPDPDNPGAMIEDRSRCKGVLRDAGLVFFAGIVGVPWQDVAVDANDLKKGYRPVKELGWTRAQFERHNSEHPEQARPIPGGLSGAITVWDQILGKLDSELNIDDRYEPLDPLMIDSVEPRSGVNPATGEPLGPPEATSPMVNRINGHEWKVPGNTDLQYACTFKLPPGKERVCTPSSEDCDCKFPEGKFNPLCQSDTGTYGTTQYRAKAYPGRRQLAVLKGIDPNQSIVASICAENTVDKSAPDYGYTPAIGAIIDRLKNVLSGTCWTQELEPDARGQVACVVLEATKGDRQQDGTVTCEPCGAGRQEPGAQALAALAQDSTYAENDLHCACEIPQAEAGAPLDACIGSPDDPPLVGDQPVQGWCYIDPSLNGGKNQEMVLSCPADQKRMIRFVGAGRPVQGSLTYLQCRADFSK